MQEKEADEILTLLQEYIDEYVVWYRKMISAITGESLTCFAETNGPNREPRNSTRYDLGCVVDKEGTFEVAPTTYE